MTISIAKSPREAFGAQMFRRGEHDVPQDHTDATLDEGGRGCIDCGGRWDWRDRFGVILYCEACYVAEAHENDEIAALVPERLADVLRAMQVKPQQQPVPRRAVVVIIPNTPRGTLYASVFHNRRNAWELPGGKVEPDEHSTIAAAREVHEELGVELKLLTEPPDDLRFVSHALGGERWVVEWFVGELVPDFAISGGNEGPAGWSTREALGAGPLGDVVRAIFAQYDAFQARAR